mmetsp:Transcript_40129/g.80884  ORF Transcript_40129/g.80884 Transcript_40129/m.80884 type:complete len:114 (+) Transcript_40129:24-365(+)
MLYLRTRSQPLFLRYHEPALRFDASKQCGCDTAACRVRVGRGVCGTRAKAETCPSAAIQQQNHCPPKLNVLTMIVEEPRLLWSYFHIASVVVQLSVLLSIALPRPPPRRPARR